MLYSDQLIKLVGELSEKRFSPTKNFKNLIKLETDFLHDSVPTRERMYYIINNTKEIVKCPICDSNTIVKYRNGKYIIQTCSVECRTKKLNIVGSDGLSTYGRSRIKLKEKMSKVDPGTGLTGYQKMGKKVSEKLSQIDSETGLCPKDIIQLKTKIRMNEVDPETGLTGAEVVSKSVKKTMSIVNPESGLTKSQEIRKKVNKTMSKVDPGTGLTGYQKMGKKVKRTLTYNDGVNLSIAQINGQKSKEKLSQVDSETGLTGYQKIAIKTKNTMSQIDPETRLTGYQKSAIKSKIKMSKVDLIDNKNGYQKNSNKAAYNKLIIGYNNKKDILKKLYTIITTLEEYLTGNNKLLKYSCNKCGSIRESYWPYIRCTKCYPYNKSLAENEVLEFCESFDTIPESNNRQIIPPLGLDIYLPDHNLAIEYNGIFWHSSDSIDSENRDYHLHKTKECKKRGIQLFHIFENEWLDPTKQNIWKSIIRNRLTKSERIYARKTEVRSVSSKDKIEFLNSNHLQGDCVSSVNLGLYLDGELVSIMTFGRSRYNKKVEWELLRFCNKIGTSVVGGASRLLKAFRNDNFGSIISYADKRRSNGNLYKKLGFELSHESEPNYFYFKSRTMILESRIKYQKHKLIDKLEIFDPNKTESENMYNNGYRKIYDCGNQVWKLK